MSSANQGSPQTSMQKMLEKEGRMQGEFAREILDSLKLAYRAFMWPILFTLALGFLGRMFLLGNANLIGVWVDSLCPASSGHCRPLPGWAEGIDHNNFLNILIASVAIGFVFSLIFRVAFSRLSALAVSQIYDETTYRASRFPLQFFDVTPVGRIVTRFSSDYGNVFRMFGGPLAEFLSIIFDLIGMVILISFASPFYLPIILIFMGANWIVYKRNRENLRNRRRDLSASRSPSISHFAESAQGAASIRSFNREATFIDRFTGLDRMYIIQKIKTVKAVLFFSWQMNALTAVLLLATGVLSWWLLQKGMITVGAIGVAFGFITLAGNTVLMFFDWLAQMEEALIGVERLDQYLRAPIEQGVALPKKSSFPTQHPRETEDLSAPYRGLQDHKSLSVELKNIHFRYAPELPMVLNDLSLKIEAGEKVGLIGRTGSGKSTLIQILLRLYPLTSGETSVGGVKLAEHYGDAGLPIDFARSLFSFIPQDPTLFRGSLRDNLDFEREHSDEELIAVLQKVGLEQWNTAQSLQLVVEERGKNLSLGEKQLLCLARAVLSDLPILIMDEATSSIDPQSEEILVRTTESLFKGKTQILIAHRLSTLLTCDRIIWLQSGKLYMSGTPAEILPVFEKTDLMGPDPMLKNSHERTTGTHTSGNE